jgi:hypothetical protein
MKVPVPLPTHVICVEILHYKARNHKKEISELKKILAQVLLASARSLSIECLISVVEGRQAGSTGVAAAALVDVFHRKRRGERSKGGDCHL